MQNQTGPRASTEKVAVTSLLAGLAMLGAFLGRHILVAIAARFPAALPENPYFVPQDAVLLYIGAPVAVTACVVALLVPGMLFVLAAGGERRVSAFLLKAFAASYALRVAAHVVALNTVVERMTLSGFATLDIVLAVPLAIVAIWRASRGAVQWPFSGPGQIRRSVTALVIPAVLVTALLPLFFWQDLSSDGVEAVEIGYSLSSHILPRFPNSLGIGSVGAGMIAMAVPVHWFVQLLGPIEAAARLPLALYLPVLYAALLELIEWNASRRLRLGEEGILVLVLAAYAAAMCFNSTYDPYSADIASPGAAFETLSAVCLAGTILFVWQKNVRWLLLFVAIGMLARPTELIILAGLALGVLLVGGDERRAHLRCIAWGAALCVVILWLHDVLWFQHVAGFANVGGQFKRWQYLTLTDGRRLLYAAIPGGLLPFLSLALWSKQDREARHLTVVCVTYFLLFYVQSFIALHHFVPAMLFPIVVFWRTRFRFNAPWVTGAAAVAAAASLLLSLPRRFAVDRTARRVGCETAYTTGDYLNDWPSHRASERQRIVLEALFIVDGGAHPERDLLLTPGQIHYYAVRCRANPAMAQYLVVEASAPPPAGAVRVAQNATASLFVRDTAAWHRGQKSPPPTDWRSPVFSIPRETLHPPVGVAAGSYQLNLGRLPWVWRLFEPRSAAPKKTGM